MISEANLAQIRKHLDQATNPLIFFDDDADGVSSFLLVYHYLGKGHGQVVNSTPRLTKKHLRKVKEYRPDLVVILDIAEVDQEFLDGCSSKVLWVDHHTVLDRSGVHYYNPLMEVPADNRPVTYWMYQALGGPLWIATVGTVADWYIPHFLSDFKKKYPDLIEPEADSPDKALYKSSFGKLYRVYAFNLKGTAREAMQSVKVLSRIEEPYELLNQSTPQGKFLYKRFARVEKEYQEVIKSIKVSKDPFVLFRYREKKYAFTSDVSNYLVAHYPDKFIMVVRVKEDRRICSLRGNRYNILDILQKSLENVEGTGGGHKAACGCVIQAKDFPRFVKNIKRHVAEAQQAMGKT